MLLIAVHLVELWDVGVACDPLELARQAFHVLNREQLSSLACLETIRLREGPSLVIILVGMIICIRIRIESIGLSLIDCLLVVDTRHNRVDICYQARIFVLFSRLISCLSFHRDDGFLFEHLFNLVFENSSILFDEHALMHLCKDLSLVLTKAVLSTDQVL